MIFTSQNNWYYWSYGNQQPFGLQKDLQTFNTHFNTNIQHKLGTFSDELKYAAETTLEFSNKPDIFFSGGLDSEVTLRAYLGIGITPNVFIVRYENDYNIYDVSYAVTVCNILDIPYTVIDFNLQKFYENDAELVSELAQIDRPRALPQCKFLELTDNLPILGAGNLALVRLSESYNEKGIWVNRCYEYEIGWSKYARAINRQAIPEWFKWTPGLVLSFLNLDWCKRLVNDEYYGKTGVNSTKIQGYREVFPDLILRKKQTGFEKVDILIEEFQSFIVNKYNGLPYRQYSDLSIKSLTEQITLTYNH
jgi:hypothetical protein